MKTKQVIVLLNEAAEKALRAYNNHSVAEDKARREARYGDANYYSRHAMYRKGLLHGLRFAIKRISKP